jgi:DNA mismatch endonuclease (patch repair protein)
VLAPERRPRVPATISLGAGQRVDYPTTTDPAVRSVMRANRRRDTKPEVELRSALHRRGLRFRNDVLIAAGDRTIRVDVALPRHHIAVFLDGCFWHCCPEHGTRPRSNSEYWRPKLERNLQRDAAANELLSASGWRVVRVWEHQDPDEAAGLIDQVVRHDV